jgi:hypothetical protein
MFTYSYNKASAHPEPEKVRAAFAQYSSRNAARVSPRERPVLARRIRARTDANAEQARALPQHAAPAIGVSALLQTTVASDPEHGFVIELGPIIHERRRFHGQPRRQHLPAARCRARVA